MSEFKRLTPERVKEAYEQTHLFPICDEFVGYHNPDGKPCSGCATSAVLLYEQPDIFDATIATVMAQATYVPMARALGLPHAYFDGFLGAFDGHEVGCPAISFDPVLYDLGVADGAACRDAVFGCVTPSDSGCT